MCRRGLLGLYAWGCEPNGKIGVVELLAALVPWQRLACL
jgi:hypothetical protein